MRRWPERAEAALAWLTAACPYLFVLLALVGTLFLARAMPPFMGADEVAHSLRAASVVEGRFVGERVIRENGNVSSGGPTDVDFFGAKEPFDHIIFKPEEKANRTDYQAAAAARLGGPRQYLDFRGASMYPAFFYLPAAAGFAVAKAFDWPVVDGLYLARGLQALACVLTGFLALRRFGRGRLLLYGVLLLPMSLSLFSTVTADGLLIATTALGCALIGGAVAEGRPMRTREVVAAALCLAMVGMTKPPYALLALGLLAAPAERRRLPLLAFVAVLAVSIAWTVFTAAVVQVPLGRPDAAVDSGKQVAYLLHNPTVIVPLALRTLAANWKGYYYAFVGVLGWLDTYLPLRVYAICMALLAVAAVIGGSWGRARAWRWEPAAALAGVLLAFGGIHAALYINWTAVAGPIVEGVAGRYFLPLACALALAIEGDRPLIPDNRWGTPVKLALTAVVLAAPLYVILAIQRTIIFRYYLD